MSKKLWGGRFSKKTDKDFFEFQKSILCDHKLARYDIVHSLIHVAALHKAGLITAKEKDKLLKALKEIREDIRLGRFKYHPHSEDIHTDIQNKVEKKLGKLAHKLHTLRSRNDQIVFDEKAYCYDKSSSLKPLLENFTQSLILLQHKYKREDFIGYTHTQRAQKVSFKDYLGAYLAMFERDMNRVSVFNKNIKIYIGSGALAGSSIGKAKYDEAIKEWQRLMPGENIFSIIRSCENPLDNVSDRDFIIEFLSILSILTMHLSRLAEDLILYSTKEFGFLVLPEEFCTGSSLMPHKKNPDFLELVRGYTGRIYGNLVSVLALMKGLPLTYNRDMQLDKEPLFHSVEIIETELKIMPKLIKGIRLNRNNIKKALEYKGLYAVDEAERLMREKKISFRQAHDIVGKKTRELEG